MSIPSGLPNNRILHVLLERLFIFFLPVKFVFPETETGSPMGHEIRSESNALFRLHQSEKGP
jgi:hypothetical protein